MSTSRRQHIQNSATHAPADLGISENSSCGGRAIQPARVIHAKKDVWGSTVGGVLEGVQQLKIATIRVHFEYDTAALRRATTRGQVASCSDCAENLAVAGDHATGQLAVASAETMNYAEVPLAVEFENLSQAGGAALERSSEEVATRIDR